MGIFDRMGTSMVSNSLDAQSLRQRVIAENIANINTPGYTAKRVRFEELLQKTRVTRQIRKTDPRHIPQGKEGKAAKIEDTQEAVDLDTEMGTLAKVQLFYGIETHNLANRFRMLKQAISGQTG